MIYIIKSKPDFQNLNRIMYMVSTPQSEYVTCMAEYDCLNDKFKSI